MEEVAEEILGQNFHVLEASYSPSFPSFQEVEAEEAYEP
jgi:hypothetical protein